MIIKQTVGSSIYLGGDLKDIEPLNFSLFNFCNRFNSELQELSDNFLYFVTTPEDYVYARTRNIHINWAYNNPEGSFVERYKRTKMAFKLSQMRAIKELKEYKEETFIHNQQDYTAHIYSFGNVPEDLDKINKFEEFIDKKVVPVDFV